MYSAKYKENEMLPLWETVKINCHHKRSISKQLHDCWFVTSYAIFFFFFAIINPIYNFNILVSDLRFYPKP